MTYKVAVLPGDGIGEEVVEQALRVLEATSKKFSIPFEFSHGLIGGAAWDKTGKHFPEETKRICEQSDAILFGSIGGPVEESHLEKWRDCPKNSILVLRKLFSFNVNYRPAKVYSQLQSICPLRKELVEEGLDLLVVRELLGDIYFGEHKTEVVEGRRVASDIAEYTEDQISSVAHKAFQAAQKRRQSVVSVDKANVLDTSRLWREVVGEVSKNYPEVSLENMFVDNCAMQIISNPARFDVILTGNLFGDILSDAAAVLPGSLGLLPSASMNESGFALYEPAGGSAPDIAGRGIANPIAQILCASLMLRYSFGLEEAGVAIENAVEKTLSQGYRTADIAEKGTEVLGTTAFGTQIIAHL